MNWRNGTMVDKKKLIQVIRPGFGSCIFPEENVLDGMMEECKQLLEEGHKGH